MSLTQTAAAIVAPLSGWLAAQDSNAVFQMAHFNDLATDWHSFYAYASTRAQASSHECQLGTGSLRRSARITLLAPPIGSIEGS
jgi:hypothetical protein